MMRVVVDAVVTPVRVELVDPDDFEAFSVILRGDGAESALSSLGVLGESSTHVFVDPDRVKELAGRRAADDGWLARFAKMTAYAGQHGWLDGEGRIRAHIVTGA
jgi:hypothetical protein